jgi:putative endonuclease
MKENLGRQGEDIAAKYLKQQGYRMLSRNFRTRYGEVDIICMLNQVIIFVEVKTRAGINYGFPEESITETKKQHIRKVALAYLDTYSQPFKEIRFDVIGILIKGGKPCINHIVAAF